LDQRESVRLITVHKHLVARLNAIAKKELFDVQVSDGGTRYCRVPGTLNVTYTPPRLATIISNGGPTFTLMELEDAASGPDEDTTSDQAHADQQTHEDGETHHTEIVTKVVDLLLPYWKRSQRHTLAVALAGYLGKTAGWSWDATRHCLERIATHAQDEELRSRLTDVRTTFQKLLKGEEVRGYTALEKILTSYDLNRLADLVGVREIPIEDITPEEPWPLLAPAALTGLAGEIVNTIAPYTEADPVALLVNLLVMFGNIIGATAHFRVEYTRLYLRPFAVLVGISSKSRKGQSMSALRRLFSEVEKDWEQHISSGL